MTRQRLTAVNREGRRPSEARCGRSAHERRSRATDSSCRNC
ncbi:conserved domain protein [Actinomyces sp. oral taxon 170 str. F0386]|nr:conserved domain protein [Actinomyces sp. oral taxon 170 str. F0386]